MQNICTNICTVKIDLVRIILNVPNGRNREVILFTNICRYGSKLIIDEEMNGGQLLIVRKYSYPIMFIKNEFVLINVTELCFALLVFCLIHTPQNLWFFRCKNVNFVFFSYLIGHFLIFILQILRKINVRFRSRDTAKTTTKNLCNCKDYLLNINNFLAVNMKHVSLRNS